MEINNTYENESIYNTNNTAQSATQQQSQQNDLY
jgi:hypothetical protein